MASATAPSGLRIRKLADTSEGERIVRFDPVTGEKKLVNPATEGTDHEPWPLAGIRIEGDAPERCVVPTSFVTAGVSEGWVELVGSKPVHRPGGAPGNEWSVTHTFVHAKSVVLKTADGDVRYRVVHQPDKYATSGDDDPVTDDVYEAGDTRVDWFYGLELEG